MPHTRDHHEEKKKLIAAHKGAKMTREIIFWAMNILGGVMGGRESAKLSRAAQKAGERCCQVDSVVRIHTQSMLRCISPQRPSRVRPGSYQRPSTGRPQAVQAIQTARV